MLILKESNVNVLDRLSVLCIPTGTAIGLMVLKPQCEHSTDKKNANKSNVPNWMKMCTVLIINETEGP